MLRFPFIVTFYKLLHSYIHPTHTHRVCLECKMSVICSACWVRENNVHKHMCPHELGNGKDKTKTKKCKMYANECAENRREKEWRDKVRLFHSYKRSNSMWFDRCLYSLFEDGYANGMAFFTIKSMMASHFTYQTHILLMMYFNTLTAKATTIRMYIFLCPFSCLKREWKMKIFKVFFLFITF